MENPNYAKPRNVLLRLQLASSTTRPRSSFVFVVNQNRALANISVIKYFISDLKPTLSIRRVDEFGRFWRLLISLKAHFSYVNYFLYCWVSCRYTIYESSIETIIPRFARIRWPAFLFLFVRKQTSIFNMFLHILASTPTSRAFQLSYFHMKASLYTASRKHRILS